MSEAAAQGEMTEFLGGRARRVPCARLTDRRGSLTPFDYADLPFTPRRVFAVADVPTGTSRGGHSHRSATQLLVCLNGRIDVLMRVRGDAGRVMLAPGEPGLLLGPGVWSQQTYLAPNSVLLVFASEPYDPASMSEHPTDPAPTDPA
jgi:hypothetical protein